MIKIKLKKRQPKKRQKRLKNKARIRKKVSGSSGRPRLCVFRSQKHIYAQLIDDQLGVTLAAASSLTLKNAESGGEKSKGEKPVETARRVGEGSGKTGPGAKKQLAVFDRGGFIYHGRVKALAEGARAGGLKF